MAVTIDRMMVVPGGGNSDFLHLLRKLAVRSHIRFHILVPVRGSHSKVLLINCCSRHFVALSYNFTIEQGKRLTQFSCTLLHGHL